MPRKAVGKNLTSKKTNDYNDLERPNTVVPADFKDVKIKNNKVRVKVPAMSVVTINLR
jgi:alpha-N-arabinofuranosidase